MEIVNNIFQNPTLAFGQACYKGTEWMLGSSAYDLATKYFGESKVSTYNSEMGVQVEKIRCEKHLKSKLYRVALKIATAVPAILLTRELAIIAGFQSIAPAAAPAALSVGQLIFSQVKTAVIMSFFWQVCSFALEQWDEYHLPHYNSVV